MNTFRPPWESAPAEQWADNGGWVYQDSIQSVLVDASHDVVEPGQLLHNHGSTQVRVLGAAGHTPGHLAIEVRSPGWPG
ncbi:hypothetical protein HNP40_001360 [Mycobacteroides chelonae]|nr:hypothetical protein [Mycobacteroides chelonae]